MLSFLSSLFSTSGKLPESVDSGAVEQAVDRAIEATDKRVMHVSSYRDALRPTVAKAMVYINELVRDFPGMTEFSRTSYVSDSRVHSLFVSYQDMQEKLFTATGVGVYLKKCRRFGNPLPEAIYGVLTVQRREKTRPGITLSGDGIQQEVMQVSVEFMNHNFIGLASKPGQAMLNLERRIFDFMLQIVMEGIIAERSRRVELQQQKRLLQRKMAAMKQGNWGLQDMLRPEHSGECDVATISTDIEQIDSELAALGASHEVLDRNLQTIIETLSSPEDILAIRNLSLMLDKMNVRTDSEQDARQPPVEFVESYSGIGATRIMMPGWFAVADIPARRSYTPVI